MLYALLLGALPSAQLAENDFTSVAIRTQAYDFGDADRPVLVGSSITGRLEKSFFADQGLDVFNLGLDGSNPVAALDIVLDSDLRPQTVAIEAHGLQWGSPTNDAEIESNRDGLSYRLAKRLAFLRAEHRPSSILYSIVKERSDGAAADPASAISGFDIQAEVFTEGAEAPDFLTADERARVARLVEQVAELRSRGSEVLFYLIPAGDFSTEDTNEIARWAGSTAGVALVDLQDYEPVTYTDNVHLDRSSASAIAALLAEQLSRP